MIKSYLKRIFNLITRPEMKILPGQLAFFLVLAIFPLLTLLGYVGSQMIFLFEPLIDTVGKIVPENVMQIILPFIQSSHITGNVLFFMIVGFILVSNGTYSIIITSNELYNIKNDDYIKDRVKAFFMIILLMFLFIFIFVVLAYGNIIIEKILDLDALSSISSHIYLVFVLLKWPIAFVLIFWILKIIYTISPDEKISSKYMNKGALFTTVCWIVTTSIYSYYVSHLANYTLFYGSISGIIVMMIWIYILTYIFVMGIAINADEYNRFKKQNKKEKLENNK
ncbi:yihY family protein [Firmicutes bacterium CAG:822]|nr:yihY family protein [Firmicutes bacterium CAG:822]